MARSQCFWARGSFWIDFFRSRNFMQKQRPEPDFRVEMPNEGKPGSHCVGLAREGFKSLREIFGTLAHS